MDYIINIDNEDLRYRNVKIKPICLLRKLIRKIVKYNQINNLDIYLLVNKQITFTDQNGRVSYYIYTITQKTREDKINCQFYDFPYKIELFKKLCNL